MLSWSRSRSLYGAGMLFAPGLAACEAADDGHEDGDDAVDDGLDDGDLRR